MPSTTQAQETASNQGPSHQLNKKLVADRGKPAAWRLWYLSVVVGSTVCADYDALPPGITSARSRSPALVTTSGSANDGHVWYRPACATMASGVPPERRMRRTAGIASAVTAPPTM